MVYPTEIALAVPVVGLFGPTNPERNGPWGTRSIVLRSRQSATSYHHTARPDMALQSIAPAEVARAALSLLEAPQQSRCGLAGDPVLEPQNRPAGQETS